MQRRTVLVTLNLIVALTVAGTALAQTEPLFGSWKLDLAKSKYNPGPAPKSATIKYEASPGGFKSSAQTFTAHGELLHYQYNAKFDGKDSPVKGNPEADTLAWRKIDDRTYEVVAKKGIKPTITSGIVVAPDGQSRVATQTGTTVKGQPVSNTLFWERE